MGDFLRIFGGGLITLLLYVPAIYFLIKENMFLFVTFEIIGTIGLFGFAYLIKRFD